MVDSLLKLKRYTVPNQILFEGKNIIPEIFETKNKIKESV